jgi:hypothetical protein
VNNELTIALAPLALGSAFAVSDVDVVLPLPLVQILVELVIKPPVVVQSGFPLAPIADSSGVVLNVQAALTVWVLVSKAAAVPEASKELVGWNAAVPNAPPAAVVRADKVTSVALVVAVTLAAVPLVFWLKVGKLVNAAALNTGAALNAGAADAPVKLPNTELAAAALAVNVNAGVVVEVATDVVNRGDSAPALNAVTVPEPPPPLVATATHVPVEALHQWLN